MVLFGKLLFSNNSFNTLPKWLSECFNESYEKSRTTRTTGLETLNYEIAVFTVVRLPTKWYENCAQCIFILILVYFDKNKFFIQQNYGEFIFKLTVLCTWSFIELHIHGAGYLLSHEIWNSVDENNCFIIRFV